MDTKHVRPSQWPGSVQAAFFGLLVAGPLLAVGPATIGPQANCTYSSAAPASVQAAIDAGYDEIRLVGGVTYTGNLFIGGDLDVTLSGGFADCASAAAGQLPTTPVRSNLRSSAALSAAVILAESGQRRRKVILRLLDIQPPAGATTTGSGLVVSGLLDAVLDRSRISRFRYAGAGGGAIVAGSDLLLMQSEISDNFGSNGGGLFCSNGSVELDAASRLLLNVANGVGANLGHGGGAYLEDCDLRSSARVLPAALGGTSGIIGNRAGQSGGGIYADHSLVQIHGGPLCGLSEVALCQPRLAIVALNRAGSKGGGLALHHSEAFIDFTQISQNEALSEGGGIHVADNSNVRFGGLAALYPNYDRSHCHEGRLCDVLSGNRLRVDALVTGNGGGVAVVNSVFTGADLYFADNSAAAGNSLHASGTSSTLLVQILLKQAELAANSLGLSAFEFSDTSTAEIRGSTLLSWHDQNVVVRAEGSATLNLRESLVGTFVPGDFSLQGVTNAVTTGECNAHIGATNQPEVFVIQADASDLDALDPIAPAPTGRLVDTCASAAVAPSAQDIYGRPRVARVSAAAPGQLLDIGALEVPTETLFASSFE